MGGEAACSPPHTAAEICIAGFIDIRQVQMISAYHLLLKDFDYHSVSSCDVFIHYSLSLLFCTSDIWW